jgi:predicted transcriptional regulator
MTPANVSPMPSKGSPKEVVRLSEDTVAALAERAKAEGVSKSDIMRRAIENELSIDFGEDW